LPGEHFVVLNVYNCEAAFWAEPSYIIFYRSQKEGKKAMRLIPVWVLLLMFLFTQMLFHIDPSLARAEEWTRAGRFEGFVFAQDMAEDEAKADFGGLTTTTQVDGFVAFGIGGGYHLNDYVSVNLGLFASSTDLKVTSGATKIEEDTEVTGMDLNIDLYPFKGRISPFVTAGIGFVSFYEDLDDHDCNCYDRDDLDIDTKFSYNAGVGIRWDVNDHLFLRPSTAQRGRS
jgi:opacity protein-like surface antigen